MEVRPADGERQRCACGEGGGGTRWDAGLGAPECLGQLQRSASARRSRIPRAPEGLCHGGEQPRAAGEHRGLRHRGRKEVMLRSCHRNRIYPSLQLQSAAQHGLLQPPPLPHRVGGGHTLPTPPQSCCCSHLSPGASAPLHCHVQGSAGHCSHPTARVQSPAELRQVLRVPSAHSAPHCTQPEQRCSTNTAALHTARAQTPLCGSSGGSSSASTRGSSMSSPPPQGCCCPRSQSCPQLYPIPEHQQCWEKSPNCFLFCCFSHH